MPYARAWNIGLRTAHIAVFGVLVGGHVFDVPKARLLPWLYATIITGAILVLIEAFPRVRWCYQGRGVLRVGEADSAQFDSLAVGLPSADSVCGDCDCLGRIAHAGPVPVLLGDSPARAGLSIGTAATVAESWVRDDESQAQGGRLG